MDNNSIKDTNDTNNDKGVKRPGIVGTTVGVSVVVIVALIILIGALIPSMTHWWAKRQWTARTFRSLESMQL